MLSKFSVKKPYIVFVGVIIIIILGCISFTSMTTDLLPSMDLPYAIVATQYVGASPEKVESVVTKPLEKALATANNVKDISSVSSENSSMVILEFNDDVNMDSALIEINGKLDLVKAAWKEDEVGTPTVMRLNPNMMPVMLSAVDIQGMNAAEITKLMEEKILPELERVDGVASVDSIGMVEDNIKVTLNQDKINAINQKILANVDQKLAETQGSLDSAQSQLNAGKSQLEAQSASSNAQIVEGLSQISQGREQLVAAEADLKSKESTLSVTKRALQATVSGLEKSKESLEKRKAELLALGNNLTPEQQVELQGIEASLQTVAQGMQKATSELSNIHQSANMLANGKAQLASQKSMLTEKEKELELAKSTLNLKLSEASSMLLTNQAKLDEGRQEFESTRDKAISSASIDSVITQSMISNILTAENFSMPAGYIGEENNKMSVKIGDKFGSLEEIQNLTLLSFDMEGLENITLQDVADITYSNNADAIYAKINGNDGIVLTFQKQSTASTATVAKNIKEAMDTISTQNSNVRFTTLMDQGVYIDIVIQSVLDNLIYGGILAVIILFIFLKDIRPTLVIALSIPISLTFAIALMYFTGVTINVVSLSGLALGVGMLVDNSIVVIENIYRLKAKGMSALEASVKGASGVAGAIAASTLTTVCVFLPIVFIQGISRQLFTDMGLTIAYSLLASLIVALTLVPAMASGVLRKDKEKEHKWFDRFVNGYEKILEKALKWKALVLILVFLVFGVSIYLATQMGTAFIPSMDGTQMSVELEFPKEVTTDEMRTKTDDAINRFLEIPEVETVGAIDSNAGSSMMMSSSNSKSMSMYLLLKEDKKVSNDEIKKQILAKTQDLECETTVSTSNMDMSSMSGSGIEVVIKGQDIKTLQKTATEVADILKQTDGIATVEDGIGDSSPETRIIVDKTKAMKNGLTVAQVYSEVAQELTNEKEATTVTIDKKDYPIVVIKSEDNRVTKESLKDIKIEGTDTSSMNGSSDTNTEKPRVILGDIASIETGDTLSAISHDNQERYVKVTGEVDTDHNIGLVSRDFSEKLKAYQAPEGYTVELSGENETINQSLQDLMKMIGLAIVLIYLIMVAQFESLLSPFIVMFTIPLAFTGGLLALFFTGTELSLIAMLGFLVLAGIVVNNGIVFIDYTNQLRREGMGRKEALLQAGKTRIRPILMTAFTTILGLLTMALGVGSGADMVQPLGIVTIGGLLYATILTLFVVPCVYDIFCKKVPKLRDVK